MDGNTFHCEKSGPKIYVRTLQALRVRPEEAVMIGDELEGDVLISTFYSWPRGFASRLA